MLAIMLLAGGPMAWAQSGSSGASPLTASPNRPSNSDSANVLATGVLQMEHGWTGVWPAAGERRHSLGGVFRFGLAPGVELRWGWDPYLRSRDAFGSRDGTGDNFLGAQYRFFQETDSAPALAVSYAVKLPSARQGLGSGEVDHAVTFLASKAVGSNSFDFNATLRLAGRPGSSGFDRNSVFFFTYARPIHGPVGVIAELIAQTRLNVAQPGFATGLAALTWQVSPRVVLDAGVDAGLSGAAPNKRIFAGLTFVIGNLSSD